jgi:K+-sensing histidine kinase KdpD
MRTRVLLLPVRPMSARLVSWIVVVALIVAETLVVCPLRRVVSEISLGVVYLVGVLVVSRVWGLALGVVTAVLSAAAFGLFYVPASLGFVAFDPQGRAALTSLLAVALVLCSIAVLARWRSVGADERRGAADLVAAIALLLLRTKDPRSARPGASARLGRALMLSAAAIELAAVAGDERRAARVRHAAGGRGLPPQDGAARAGRLGSLVRGAFACGARP